MILIGKKVRLRPIEPSDLELMRELINDPWYESMTVGWSFAISSADQKKWYESFQNDANHLRFIIEDPQLGAVGVTGLKNINWKDGVADGGGMKIAKRENMSHGIATDAYMTLLHYAFYELRLRRINGSVLSYNKASRRATAKVGYKEEGIQRKAVYKNGEFYDVILLGVLKEDYDEVVRQTHYWDE